MPEHLKHYVKNLDTGKSDECCSVKHMHNTYIEAIQMAIKYCEVTKK